LYLKSLELHGFKSFPNRTTLNFGKGATVIIGPNGSGKSNISDAMRWVLGEMSTKNIRGSKMEDVIFGGADTRRPMGFAEVSVTFDNSEGKGRIDSPYSEITVTRRYYRSGESEYFINKKPVRLRDINEMFLNTGIGRDGYSIIGQGKISEILSKKSEDRRAVFEEAAGIAKYRNRKTESESRLAQTISNMERIADSLYSMEERLGPLEKESARARKYLDLYEQKKRTDVSLWLYDTENLRNQLSEVERAKALSGYELEAAEEASLSLDNQYERLFEESKNTRERSGELLENIKKLSDSLHAIESEFKVSESEKAHIEEMERLCAENARQAEKNIAASKEEVSAAESEKSVLQREMSALESEYSQTAEKAQSCTNRISALSSKLEEKLNAINALEAERTDISIRISALESAVALRESKGAEDRGELAKQRAALGDAVKAMEEREKLIAGYNARAEAVEKSVKELEASLEKAQASLETLASEINEHAAKKDSLEAKATTLEDMERHFEGYSDAVAFVMDRYKKGDIRGAGVIYGPLSHLISANDEHITAIETALAANIQNIVTDNEETAKAAINLLKETGRGRATFYPVSTVKGQDETPEMRQASRCRGFIGRADALVKAEGKFSDILSRLLGRTLVFDNLDNAAAAARSSGYRVKLVTLDGQVINAGGSFTGGSVRTDSRILSRAKDISSLRERAALEARETDKLSKEASELENRKKALALSLANEKQTLSLLEKMRAAAQAEYEAFSAKADSAKGLCEKLGEDMERSREQSDTCEKNIGELKRELLQRETEIAALKAGRADTDLLKSGEEEYSEKLREESNALLVRMAERRKDIGNAEFKILAAKEKVRLLATDLDLANKKISDYRATALAIIKRQEVNRENRETLLKELEIQNRLRSEAEADGSEFEIKLTELREKIRQKAKDKELKVQAHMLNTSRYERLCETSDRLSSQLWDEYELTYADAAALNYPVLTAQTRKEAAGEQAKLKNSLKSLSNVNVGAIEEYAQLKAKYEEQKKQYADLVKSKDDLQDIISKMEEEMRRKFLDTFESVGRNFSKVFSEFFGGGHAELILANPEDVLTCGIEVKAAPPGKIIKNLSLLSGGEQTFTAIALYFAIFMVNPSPFCILDEIEAALDEVNVNRFAEYIKRFDGDTQFILITHRRGTMEAADSLYGVTMPEHGISKIIPLNASEFESKKEEFGDGVF